MPFNLNDQVQLTYNGIDYLLDILNDAIYGDVVGTVITTPATHEGTSAYHIRFEREDFNHVPDYILEDYEEEEHGPIFFWLEESEIQLIDNTTKEKTSGFKEFQHRYGTQNEGS